MTEHSDVLVIGSGAGGGAVAWRLAAAGKRVLVVEAGPAFDPAADYAQDRDTWESPFPQKKGSKGQYDVAPLQALTPDTQDIRSWNGRTGPYVTGNQRQSFGYHHVRGVGGSSLSFTGEAHRMNPRSMALETNFGVGADWPVSYEELQPYWQLAEDVVGIAGPETDRRCPRNAPYPQMAHPLSYASQRLAKGAKLLGLTVQPNSLAVLSAPRSDRPSCNYCGGCQRGCQITDKGSIDVTYLRKAVATGFCEIRAATEVLKLQTNGDKITGALIATGTKQEVITADIVFVACGAVQTPRLLFNSADEFSPDGLCNESGLLGRNFMETLLFTSTALHPDNLGSHRGLPVDWVAWDYNAPDSIPNMLGGCRFGPAMAESDLVGPVSYATRVLDGWGKEHKRDMRTSFGRVLSIAALGECLPNDKSYITLSERTDRHGLPVAKIHSQLDQDAHDRLRFMASVCRNILKSAGAGPTLEEFSSADAFSSTHVFGTCRMGYSAQDSVVDPWGRSHRWPNLFITDASLFPSTGGGESPGLTIQALALRAADHLLKQSL